jgi:hypothetical protein
MLPPSRAYYDPENKHNCGVAKQPLIIVAGAAGFIGSAPA